MLARKNPYLLRAKGLTTPRELVQAVLDAHLSSQEETLLGGFLEGLAIFLGQQAYGAHGKSNAEGIDLEFEVDKVRYLVAIKSGPNWGNSSQIKKMQDNFKKATKIYKQGGKTNHVECVSGCCYGRQRPGSENKGNYRKLCGQRFWEFITGDPAIYTQIIQPLGEKARERNEAFRCQCEHVVDEFVEDFRARFCDQANSIKWEQLVEFTSAAQPIGRGLKWEGQHRKSD